NDMELVPDNIREQFDHTVDWLESWPAIRNYGLGTRLPFDDEFVIEPLSDSTIYMAFYTIRHVIDDVDPDRLDPVFFDHVFNGEKDADAVAEETGIDVETVREARASFDYWYPLDWRTTANELIQNHLTFMLYHHTALFDEDNWPEGIATWGLGTLEGEKMSSSKGHVVLPDDAIAEYGADTVRFFLYASSEPWQDFDWRADEVAEYRDKVRTFYNRSLDLYGSGTDRDMATIDRYARSRLQRIVRETTEALEEFQTRTAGMQAFFALNDLINHYRDRADTLHADVIDDIVTTQVKLMAPFTPHLCEELWDRFGHDGFVSAADWPEPDEDLIDPAVEAREELLQRTVDDIAEVAGLVGGFDTIRLVVADAWKRDAVRTIADHVAADTTDIGAIMDDLMQDETMQRHGDSLQTLVQDYTSNPGDLPDVVLDEGAESGTFADAATFITDRFDADLVIEEESESDHEKAERARPGKPAIVLE
ncbi:MAG: class I tRNA ligase family protein, partial [Candidatus Nanohaloarchaea archaeon]